MSEERRFALKDLVIIAMLASVGGVLSAYIGYIGNLINVLFHVPFGAGQVIAGLHILWLVLANLLVGRFGAGTAAGAVKGLVEFFSGSTHGLVIVLVSAAEGLLVDLGMSVFRRPRQIGAAVGGALGAISNVLVFQILYVSTAPWFYLVFMCTLAMLSGLFFGGIFSWDIYGFLVKARLARAELPKDRWGRRGRILSYVLSSVVLLAFMGGGVYYYLKVYEPLTGPGICRVAGLVEKGYIFRYDQFQDEEVAIIAELKGSVTYVPPRSYRGIPVKSIIGRAVPAKRARLVEIRADDGYSARFELAAVMADAAMILVKEEEQGGLLRLVAKDYSGSLWVSRITRLEIK